MTKGRLEAFSDGVFAIVMTIMVLELRAPHEATLAALRPLVPAFLGYVLSFVFLGIYWNNHHHLLQAVRQVDGRILWANLHLLFWITLVPFVTAWMSDSKLSSWPVAAYGAVLLAAAVAYTLLARALVARHGLDSALARALGTDRKGRLSIACYVAALAAAFWEPRAACALYVFVALLWLVPDRRIERTLADERS